MKIIITLLLSILLLNGYSQSLYDLKQNTRITNDSNRLNNYVTINEKDKAAINVAINKDVVLIDTITGKSYLKVRNTQLSVDIVTVTNIVKASIPTSTPTDLTAILSRLTTAENRIEQLVTENNTLKSRLDNHDVTLTKNQNEILTLQANNNNFNGRIISLEQSSTSLTAQLLTTQQTIKDSSLALRTGINTLNTKFNGLNTAVYVRMNSADSKIANHELRIKALEAKFP